MYREKKGFTLIELSIVLVIIGLIVGGVLVGRELIEAAEERAVVGEIQKHQTAFNMFKLKYNAMPGDYHKAYDLWGSNCAALAATCNGNHNRRVTYLGGDTDTYCAWNHMANADLASGTFPCKGASSAAHFLSSDYLDQGYYQIVWNNLGSQATHVYNKNKLQIAALS